MNRGRWLVLVFVLSGLACSKQGAMVGPAVPPTSTQPPPPPAPTHSESSSTATVSPFAPPVAGTAPQMFPQSLPREVQIMGAVILLENEFQQLQGPLSACESACRSLASMERAVQVICTLTQGEERTRCDEARKRLREARSRVREACKVCPDGTSTDPDDANP